MERQFRITMFPFARKGNASRADPNRFRGATHRAPPRINETRMKSGSGQIPAGNFRYYMTS